jgi:hypothetical protein
MKYKRMATTDLTGETDVEKPGCTSYCASQKAALKALAYAYLRQET